MIVQYCTLKDQGWNAQTCAWKVNQTDVNSPSRFAFQEGTCIRHSGSIVALIYF